MRMLSRMQHKDKMEPKSIVFIKNRFLTLTYNMPNMGLGLLDGRCRLLLVVGLHLFGLFIVQTFRRNVPFACVDKPPNSPNALHTNLDPSILYTHIYNNIIKMYSMNRIVRFVVSSSYDVPMHSDRGLNSTLIPLHRHLVCLYRT
jgi:hypothetical protein